MTEKNITRAELAEAVYHEVGLSSSESAKLLDQVLDEISAALERGDTVKLSSFGTFSVRSKRMRMGRNPKTGVEVPITPRRILSFRPSQILKQQVNAKK
ncbi:MAG TPA: integration host factor subunit alpha [Alphaproteobacteria bacterium]|nr:integration host factor subunit alpha [Alphaproteobacteria bacterium]